MVRSFMILLLMFSFLLYGCGEVTEYTEDDYKSIDSSTNDFGVKFCNKRGQEFVTTKMTDFENFDVYCLKRNPKTVMRYSEKLEVIK